MRRSAKFLGIHRETVRKKSRYLGKKCRLQQQRLLQQLKTNKVQRLELDDLITKENSKLKPAAVSVAVDGKRRLILAVEVSQIPAFGHLAKRAREKYGHRKCHHRIGLHNLFEQIKDVVEVDAEIRSDEHRSYPEFVEKYFPNSKHLRFKSERSCIAGQGELKKTRFDPIFSINHTCASLRANVNRLIRKTWCTTKRLDCLKDHLDIYVSYFNSAILLEKDPFLSAG
jgi:hypothetical protein